MTKEEWVERVYKEYYNIFNEELPKDNHNSWWIYSKSMHLTDIGYSIFRKVNIEYFKFEYILPAPLTGSILLGLSRMPCPYWMTPKAAQPTIYIFEQQYALLLKMMDLDLETFARGFLEK